jgi:hypothetical protein
MPHLGVEELSIILLIALPIVLLSSILPVIAFWKICSRAGFNGALGLLMLVPVANIILPLYVAFAQWPVFKQDRAQNASAPE